MAFVNDSYGLKYSPPDHHYPVAEEYHFSETARGAKPSIAAFRFYIQLGAYRYKCRGKIKDVLSPVHRQALARIQQNVKSLCLHGKQKCSLLSGSKSPAFQPR